MNTREKILVGARNHLLKNGQAGFTVRAVAAEAEVNPGLVHHYFGSKDNLILSLVEAESENLLENAQRMKNEVGIERMKKAMIDNFFSNMVVGQLFVEAIILAEHKDVLKKRLGEIIRSRREEFTNMMGISDPVDKVLMQAAIFGLHLVNKIDSEVEMETSVNRLLEKFTQNAQDTVTKT